jgi:hypothetical protein
MDMDRAKKLIEHLISNPDSSESDGVAYELLTEYQRGSPIESLRTLLSSSDDRLAGEGTWIASELPEEGKSLLDDVRRLLEHPSKKVRFWAIDCVHLWASSLNGNELSSAVALVDDVEKAVRWQAMGFLATISSEKLQAALTYLNTSNPKSPCLHELHWLLGPEGSDPKRIMAGLRGSEARHRRFAAAAAFRIARSDLGPLQYGASTDDSDVAQFTGDMLKRLTPPPSPSPGPKHHGVNGSE